MKSMVLFIFSVFNQKHPFRKNLVPMFKIVCFEYAAFNGDIHLFCFLTGNTLFEQISSKNGDFNGDVYFFRFRREITFSGKFVPIFKISL